MRSAVTPSPYCSNVVEQLLTPSKITAWLDCAHYLTLKQQVETGEQEQPSGGFGAFARLIADKGLEHEHACLAEYKRQGKRVHVVPDRPRGLPFADWITTICDPLASDADVIYQMPFVHDGVRGIADFVIRVTGPDTGTTSWEPVDAKLARATAKPGHVLQLCFYAEAIEAATGTKPKHMHIWLGSGRTDTLAVDQFRPYWHRIKAQLADVLDEDPDDEPTHPEPCDHCEFCEFFDTCTAQWRAEDSLQYVAGIRTVDRWALEDGGVATLAALAELDAAIEDIRDDRLTRLVDQATLQARARLLDEGEHPPYELIEPADDPTWGHGFELLPRPDDGDVFLDFEGHPFWQPDTGLFFLFGWIERDKTGTWTYRTEWAHDLEEEAAAAARLIEHLAKRRARHPGMHVYHYNHTERSALQRLAAVHGVGEAALSKEIDTGLFVDLLLVARNALQAGTESYSLKELERLTDFERGHEIDAGAGAVIEYDRWCHDHDQVALDRIAAYNEDDVRATRALRDWLTEQRPADVPWRVAELAPTDNLPNLDEKVEQLHAFGPGSSEHFLGDVLGYWRREWQAHLAPLLSKSQGDVSDLLDTPDVIAGLEFVSVFERVGAKGRARKPASLFRFPPQALDAFRDSDNVVFPLPEGGVGYADSSDLDREQGIVHLRCKDNLEAEVRPAAVARNDFFHPRAKADALDELATRVLDPSGPAPNPVALALLRRDPPKFVPGGGPPDGRFTDDLDEMRAWATQLDGSFVSVQGPPGTGKTFRGAHLIRAMVLAGLRVGVTAFSHLAIANLVNETVEVFEREGGIEQLRAVRKPADGTTGSKQPGVTLLSKNSEVAADDFNLVAGTTWLFASPDMVEAPVDVLMIDEAGQLALADALAATRSARNLVLLGDPSQLPQVSKALHPNGSGASVLQHVLGADVTMPDDRGVFLSETRRMHPDVCQFISDAIYDGRIHSHPSCAQQTTELGTGLRWLRAEHDGCVTESVEEAELVGAQIGKLMGTNWTNQHGEVAPLGAKDFMVVAPYNDQVHLLRELLADDPTTEDVPVGTVDKFQGRQAAVIFFTMTTSSMSEMVRGAEFLFSRERLNVAVSRARCLAYLVCTEELLNSRARDVDQMRLLSTLCSFVEHAQVV
jgi:uncharacterized protein